MHTPKCEGVHICSRLSLENTILVKMADNEIIGLIQIMYDHVRDHRFGIITYGSQSNTEFC